MSERSDENREKTELERWPLRFREPEIPEDEPFENDELDRKKYADLLTQLLRRTETPLVLGLDSDWGTGKTTFAKMWQKQLELDGFKTLYFNAWETDYVAEPLVALVGELDIARKGKGDKQYNQVKKVAGEVLRKGVPVAIRLLTSGLIDIKNQDVEDALENLAEHAAKESIDSYLSQKTELKEFRKALTELLDEISDDKPLVFFIDELDRCRPTFAVELLERIKHLCEVEGIVFVLVMHREQLAHSVRGLYGGDFDAGAYLRRFLDLAYTLPAPEPERYGRFLVRNLDLRGSGFGDGSELIFLMDFLNFSLREQERCVARAWLAGRTLVGRTTQGHPLLPVLVALAEWRPQLFQEFVEEQKDADEILVELENRRPHRWRSSRDGAAWIEASLLLFESLRRGRNLGHGRENPTPRFEEYRAKQKEDPDWAGEIVGAYERIGEHQAFGGGLRVMNVLVSAVQVTRELREDSR